MSNLWDQATAEADKLWNGIKKDCEQVGADVQTAFNNCLKKAEAAIIKDVVAPVHSHVAGANVRHNEQDKEAFLRGVANEWATYANNVDGGAKGQWATQAKQTIQDDAKKVIPS